MASAPLAHPPEREQGSLPVPLLPPLLPPESPLRSAFRLGELFSALWALPSPFAESLPTLPPPLLFAFFFTSLFVFFSLSCGSSSADIFPSAYKLFNVIQSVLSLGIHSQTSSSH